MIFKSCYPFRKSYSDLILLEDLDIPNSDSILSIILIIDHSSERIFQNISDVRRRYLAEWQMSKHEACRTITISNRTLPFFILQAH